MNGIYGTVKPADIDISKDVEMYYQFRPGNASIKGDLNKFKKLDTSFLTQSVDENNSNIKISGLFNLKLPIGLFSSKGIYDIYIKPSENDATITEVASLSSYTNVRGVVFSLRNNDFLRNMKAENSLAGYRIEYLDEKGENKTGEYTIITSSNCAEAEPVAFSNSTQKSISYRYTSTGGYLFCTVSPSISSSFKPNSYPFIGKSGQKVKITNTKFNPVLLEIEMVEHDFDTLSNMLEGNQIRNLDNGLITTYNSNNEIYHQSEYFTLKDDYGKPLYDIKNNKQNIDFKENYEDIINK